MEKSKAHIMWIDWAKIIGIFLVTLGHGGLVGEEFKNFIYSFHMPLFFVISGYLYYQRSFVETFKRGLKTLIIPYLLINLILLIYFSVLWIAKGMFSIEVVLSRVIPVFLGLGYSTETLFPMSGPCWFIIVIFFIQLLVSINSSRLYHIALMIFSIVLFYLLSYLDIDTLVPIDSTMMAIPFFIIAVKFKSLYNKSLSIYWVAVLFGLLLLLNIANGRVDINTCNYGSNLIFFYVSGFIGSVLIFQLSKMLKPVNMGGVCIRNNSYFRI